jgi:iron complex outermembrane recepter protein
MRGGRRSGPEAGDLAQQNPAGPLLKPALAAVLTIAAAMTAPAALAQQPVSQEAATQRRASFNIAPQPLSSALVAFSQATQMQLFFNANLARGKNSPGARGPLTNSEAVRKILAGSGLTYRISGGTVTIVDQGAAVITGSTSADGSIALEQINISGENAWGPVQGYVAKRSASGTKTDTPLIETPQSVSIVTADQIKTTKPASMADALSYTPGIVSQSPAFSRMVDDFMVRGFNVATGDLGMLRDGMKLQTNVYDGAQEPYGLERVEVLRGASSMLYGQLGPGGVVNAISKRPTAEPLHEVNVEYGSYDRKQVSADFGGPLTEDGAWSYRLTGLLRDADNWVDDVPDDRRYIAPALKWSPDDATSLTLLGSYQQIRTRFAPPLPYDVVRSERIPRDMFVGQHGYDRYDSDMFTLGYLFEHEFDNGLKLRNNARYFRADVQWDYLTVTGLSGDTLRRGLWNRTEKSTGFTTDTSLQYEFDTGPAEHTVLGGIDYYRGTYESHRFAGAVGPLDLSDPVYDATPIVNFASDRGWYQSSKQIGVYLQDQIKIDKWVLLLGGRYDWSDSGVTSYRSGVVSNRKDEAFTGRAGLVYLFDNGLAPYASVSQSFAPTTGPDGLYGMFEPSKGTQYEVGLRYQPPGSNFLLSAAIYDLTQTNVVTSADGGITFEQIGEVRSRGFELEAKAEFGNLNLIGSYAYTDARSVKGSQTIPAGERVALVPYHTVSLWADYALDDVGLKGAKIGAGARYLSSANVPDFDKDVPGRVLVDAMVSYDFGAIDKKYEGTTLSVNARNLFDKKYYTCVDSGGCRYGEPLTVTASLGYRW